jgi:cell wall-associated NlpC family hydrolase
VLFIAVAAACLAAGSATGDPSVTSKRAQAQQVMSQIQQLGSSLERARNRYETASLKLRAIEHDLTVNKVALRAARGNLVKSQAALSERLYAIYTTRDDQTTLAVLLGAQSIEDLVNRIETVQSLSQQDVSVMNSVLSFKREVTVRGHKLTRDRHDQKQLVAQRAAAKASIGSQLGRQQRLLSSIKGEIAHLIAMQNARQLALRRAATASLSAQQSVQAAALADAAVGATASTPDGSVAPPSQYGGVVGIAMKYLGIPYVWGGSSPGGFDCSGFTMYVYGQMGVSLPHYTGSQWGMGVPVSRGDLQPGDLVFFNGLGHMGIYIGGNQMIHAPHSGDVVKISPLTGWYDATYVGARRITG